jgi:hypothetical protein
MNKYKVIYNGVTYNIKTYSSQIAKSIFFNVLMVKNRVKLYSLNGQTQTMHRVTENSAWIKCEIILEEVSKKEYNVILKPKIKKKL